MIKRLVSGVNAWQGEPVTRRADFNARHQAGVLNGLWLESGLDQTTAAANGGMSQSSFWRLIKGHQPLREDQYPSMARALSVSEADLRRALLGEADDDDEQAPPDWDLRAELAAILPDAVVAVLADLRKRQPARQALVFGHGDRAYCAQTYRRWLNVRCRQAGVPELPPHSARHTAASLALDAGVPVQDVAKQLGHSVQTCLRAYSHYVGRGQRRAANALGSALDHRFSGPQHENGVTIGTRHAP